MFFRVSMIAILFFISSVTFAETLAPYPGASCADITGVWQGFVTDTTGLFDDGGPWPINIALYEHAGKITGRSSAIKAKHGVNFPPKEIWADCKDGKLTNIIWGNKGECGGSANDGILVSKNVLVLPLAWENAMNGTLLYAFLQRKNNQYPYIKPTQETEFNFGKRDTCH